MRETASCSGETLIARHSRARGLGDMDRKGAPAGADLGDPHPGAKAQLGRGAHQLGLLRLLKRVRLWIVEERAGVVEARVKE